MKKTKLSDMTEHLFEMAERLLDEDDVCIDTESTEREVKKAKTMVDLASAVCNIESLQIQKDELELKACKLANDMGIEYIPRQVRETLPAGTKAKPALSYSDDDDEFSQELKKKI